MSSQEAAKKAAETEQAKKLAKTIAESTQKMLKALSGGH
jgi:hypothetical protein